MEITIEDVLNHFGFVYELELSSGKRYIGSKQFWVGIDYLTERTKNTEQTNWVNYLGSSKVVDMRLAVGETVTDFKVISFHQDKFELSQAEADYQKEKNAVKSPRYLNLGVSPRLTPESELRRKTNSAKTQTGMKRKSTINMSLWQKGKPKSEQHRAALAKAKLGVKQTEEHKANIAKALKEHNRNNPRSAEHVRRNIENRRPGRYVQSLTIDGKVFKSIRDASVKMGTSEHKVRRMISDGLAAVVYK